MLLVTCKTINKFYCDEEKQGLQDRIIISSIKLKENETFVSVNILKFTKNNLGRKKSRISYY